MECALYRGPAATADLAPGTGKCQVPGRQVTVLLVPPHDSNAYINEQDVSSYLSTSAILQVYALKRFKVLSSL